MLDGVSLDQLRTLVAAVDEGSFSAAARKLRRVQSVVSHSVNNLEEQLGITLFDRSVRQPRLTSEGQAVLGDARAIIDRVDMLKARAKAMAAGVEPELSVVVDVLFPMDWVVRAAHEFRIAYPNVPLRLHVEALGAAYAPVMDERCSLGIVGSLPLKPASLAAEALTDVRMVMVASPGHPLSSLEGLIARPELAKHVQLVLTDRSDLSAGREFGVYSPLTWRLADLSAKHAFLVDGLGWGGMPVHTVKEDVARGRLKVLALEDLPAAGLALPMAVVYPRASPPGPAGRWFVDFLRAQAALPQPLVRAVEPVAMERFAA